MSEVCAMIFTGEVIVRCCYGHRLNGYAGRCARIHGHNGVVTVRVEADSLDAQGFVADFYEIRTAVDVVVDGFDHALDIGVKIGTGESEDDTEFVLIEHHGIDEETSVGILKREGKRQP